MRRRDFIRGLGLLGISAAVADRLAFVQGLGRVFPSAGDDRRAFDYEGPFTFDGIDDYAVTTIDSARSLMYELKVDADFYIAGHGVTAKTGGAFEWKPVLVSRRGVVHQRIR